MMITCTSEPRMAKSKTRSQSLLRLQNQQLIKVFNEYKMAMMLFSHNFMIWGTCQSEMKGSNLANEVNGVGRDELKVG